MSDIQHKAMELKELSSEGSLAAVISTFQKDRDGDVMTREAFAGSDGKTIPMVWSHNWDQPIGKGIVKVADNGAEFHGQFHLDTVAGEQAYKTVKAMGDLQQYSIGFRVIDSTREKKDGEWVRTFNDIELFEASPVLVGAAFGTRTIDLKSTAISGANTIGAAGWDITTIGAAGTNNSGFVWVANPLEERLKALEELLDELDLAKQIAELRELLEKQASRHFIPDIPELETEARKKQRLEIDALLSTVQLEG